MKDLASCFSDHAVRVSDSSCSGSSRVGVVSALDASVRSAVSSLYRARLSSSHKDILILINVTWSKSHSGPTISLAADKSAAMTHWVLRDKAGEQVIAVPGGSLRLYWDLSSAGYSPDSPEPLNGFYLVAISGGNELALALGDMSGEFVKGFRVSAPMPAVAVSRREQTILQGRICYTTRVRFRDGGDEHDISIRCKGEPWSAAESELSVCIDKKRVVHVGKLEYNFRGNQTVFVEGSPVDLMWDVHDWWFSGGPSGYAAFLFRTRSTLESRLWLEEQEEEVQRSREGMYGFSLLVEAFKSPIKIAGRW